MNSTGAVNPFCTAKHIVSAIVHYQDMEVPYMVKIPCQNLPGQDKPYLTLAIFKDAIATIPQPSLGNYSYFFRKLNPTTQDASQWEATNDDQELPVLRVNALTWRLTAILKNKPDSMDEKFRESANMTKADIDEIKQLAAKMGGMGKCYGQSPNKMTTVTTADIELVESAVDESEAAKALQTLRRWVRQNKGKSEALVHLAKFEDICFPDGI